MDLKHYLIESLKHNIGFVTHTLSDFTDADLFVRPCPGANHAAWQLGHFTNSEAGVVKTITPGFAVALPDGFSQAFNMEANKQNDPEKFAPFNTKSQLIELFTQVRGGTVAWIESLSPEQLDSPSPEKFTRWAPTLGLLASGQIGHCMMHVGQFQVIRRKLGKPVLF